MLNFCRSVPLSFNRILSRSLVISTLATIGLLLGLAPDLSGRSSNLGFSSAAYAQAVSDAEVRSYARAVLAAEPLRQASLNEIKKLIGSKNTGAIACDKPETLRALPNNAEKIAVDYCNKYQNIVESNGLPIRRFNAITMRVQKNPRLKKRIQDEMLRLQKGD